MIRILLLLFLLASCQDLNSNSSDNSKYGSGVPSGSAQFQEAYYIIKDRCANCHSSTIHNKWSSYLTQADWENESTVTFGNADASSFITRIKNYGPSGDMPQGGGALDDAEYEKIFNWVNTP